MKKQKPRLTSSGFTVCRFKKDAIHKHHYLYQHGLGGEQLHFESFRGWVMEYSSSIPTASRVLACLLAFDGILVSADLSLVYQNLSTAQDGLIDRRVSWRMGLRHDARNLSAMTLIAIAGIQRWPGYEDAIAGLLQVWNQALKRRRAAAVQFVTWEDLLRQAQSWMQTVLPPVLYGHVTGVSSLCALPPTALRRKSTHLALSMDLEVTGTIRDACKDLRHIAWEAALLGSSVASSERPKFCAELEERLRPSKSGSVTSRRQGVATALRAMAGVHFPKDEGCALLLLFAVDLVENGTRRKQSLAPETPSKYVSSFAVDWLNAFSGISIDGIEATEYEKRFKSLLAGGCTSERIAGLKAFHHFLRMNWDVPSLSRDVFPESPEAEVRANVLWLHEKLRIRDWIDAAKTNVLREHERRVYQLQVAFEIAAHVPLRIKELLMLRVKHVVFEAQHVVIEVARALKDGREKSKEGRRRVKLCDEVAMETLRAWVQRRRWELSDEEGYLFGDPSNQEVLYAKGWMYDTLNQLLKHASGDEQLSMHTLRHTYASFALDRILQSDSYGEINPLDQLASEMGHVGGHVTTHHYCHIFESGLRRALDLQTIPCSYETVAQWVALPPDTLRKRVSRAGCTKEAKTKVFQDAFEEAVQRLPCKSKSQIAVCSSPVSPINVPVTGSKPLDAIVSILMDMASGIEITNIVWRHSVELKHVEKIARCVSHYVLEHTGMAVEISDKSDYARKVLKGKAGAEKVQGAQLGFKPSFQHLQRAHWQRLLKALADTNDESLAQLLSYWQRARKGSHLSVHSGDGWRAFLQLLKRSGLNSRQMVLAHDPLPQGDANEQQGLRDQLESVQEDVKNVFGDGFTLAQCKYRGGQPSVRLLILQKPVSHAATPPIACMHGLHCLFLAAWVARRFASEAL